MTVLPSMQRAAVELCSNEANPYDVIEGGPRWKSEYLGKVRAIVRSIEIPTEKMTEAGNAAYDDVENGPEPANAIWAAMIGVILSDPEPSEQTRATVCILRVPTPAMTGAGDIAVLVSESDKSREVVNAVWAAMIRTVLNMDQAPEVPDSLPGVTMKFF